MSFNDFQFHHTILTGIKNSGYTTPTPIQQQSIQPILDGKDLLGLAQTGTGKTAAFVLPMLQRLQKGPRNRIRALIMAPTRELAQQIHNNVRIMGQKTGLRSCVIYGGVGRQPQLQAMRKGVEIVVACPGRLLDLLNEKGISLSSVDFLVLDEADHMFDKGFLPDMRRIIAKLPKKRQSVIFSATMPKEIERLTKEVLTNPTRIQIDNLKPTSTISHSFYSVKKTTKTPLLKTLLQKNDMTRTLVFTRTKHKARSLAISLQKMGFKAVSMQGNLSQQKRQQALEGFRSGNFTIMVATDIAARGIDVQDISHVINFDIPDTLETYTHRTGRTGRAQQLGQAITFAEQDDTSFITAIKNNLDIKVETIQPSKSLGSVETKKNSLGKTGTLPKATFKVARTAKKKQPKQKKRRAMAFDFGLKPQATTNL